MIDWLRSAPIWLVGALLLLLTIGSAMAASQVNRSLLRGPDRLSEAQQGYVVSSVYALLGLLVAFTFQVAVERYQARRHLVIEDATAIQALYLKSQLLPEPHRSTLSNLLVSYAENHVALAKARSKDPNGPQLLQRNEMLLHEIWRVVIPAFASVKTLDFSSSFVDSAAEVVRINSERMAARRPPIPTTILVILLVYTIVAAGVLGSVMKGRRGIEVSVILIALNILALLLVMDINRPVEGTIREPQEPMERMVQMLQANPPSSYDAKQAPTNGSATDHLETEAGKRAETSSFATSGASTLHVFAAPLTTLPI